MPRASSTEIQPDWTRLAETAAGQSGLFTLAQAKEAGYSPQLVQHYVKQSKFERVGWGILRLAHFPISEQDDLIVRWLWSEQYGVFSHDTALLLHDLSDAFPARHHLTVPKDWKRSRLRPPEGTVLHFADLPSGERTWKGTVPVTTPLRTVLDCVAEHVNPELIEQAIAQGTRQRLFTRAEIRRRIDALGTTAPRGRSASRKRTTADIAPGGPHTSDSHRDESS